MSSPTNISDLKKTVPQLREKFEVIITASISSTIGMTLLLTPIFDNSSIFIAILFGIIIGIGIAIRKKKE